MSQCYKKRVKTRRQLQTLIVQIVNHASEQINGRLANAPLPVNHIGLKNFPFMLFAVCFYHFRLGSFGAPALVVHWA